MNASSCTPSTARVPCLHVSCHCIVGCCEAQLEATCSRSLSALAAQPAAVAPHTACLLLPCKVQLQLHLTKCSFAHAQYALPWRRKLWLRPKCLVLTRNKNCSPYTTEEIDSTGFQSSRKMLRQMLPSMSMLGWYTWCTQQQQEAAQCRHGGVKQRRVGRSCLLHWALW